MPARRIMARKTRPDPQMRGSRRDREAMSTSPTGTDPAATSAAGTTQMATLGPDESPFFNRELSWLQFNQRVLAEACNAA